MTLRNNFLLLREYRTELRDSRKINGGTNDIYESYESHILDWADEKALNKAPSFKTSFPEFLNHQTNPKGKPLSTEYMKGACGYLRRFFEWARDNKKEYKSMKGSWIKTIAPVKRPGKLPDIEYYTKEELEQICNVVPENLRMQRMIAAIAFLLLTGMRISAFLTLPIKNVSITAGTVDQVPEDGVCTKGNKAATTSIYKISKLIKIVKQWDDLVRTSCPENSSWFARLNQNGEFDPRIIEPMTIDNADELKKKARNPRPLFYKDLKQLCDLAGVEYKSPHKARHGHIHLGLKRARNYEERKAVSQNVMHETVTITDAVYSRMKSKDANEIISNFVFDDEESPLPVLNSESLDLKSCDPSVLRQVGAMLINLSGQSRQ